MTAFARVRRSIDTTAVVHVVLLVTSAALASAIASVVAPVLGENPADATTRGLWFEGGRRILHARATWIAPCAILGAFYVLIEPWLAMAWQHGLTTGARVRGSLRRGLTLYLPLWGARIALVSFAAFPFALALALPAGLHVALEHARDPRVHDLLVLAALSPSLVLVLVTMTVHDLAMASLVVDGPRPLEALLLGFRACGAGRVATRALAAALGVGLGLVATWVAPGGETGLHAGLLAMTAQGLLLGRTLVRATWLATCSEPAARRAPG